MAANKSTKDPAPKRTSRRSRKETQNEQAKSWFREWADALIFAAVAAIIIRAFFFEAYRIPTPSMEKTLMTGDFLIVSKISYGPRTPMVIGVPFTNIYMSGVVLPWTRLPGISDVERNDIVVFNYPPDTAPISAKTNYIKRNVGIPGDTLAINDKQLYVNGEQAKYFSGIQQHYVVEVRDRVRLSPSKVEAAGGTLYGSQGENKYRVNMSREVMNTISQWAEVNDVYPLVLPDDFNEYGRRGFSFSAGFNNHHHMAPVVVPFEGQSVTLTPENWHVYERVLTYYEGNNVTRNGSQFVINGEETNEYTIQQNYYFMMGDNRDDSEDSRFWGFVPESHIVGKAGIIYFSWDKERWMPRFDRILNLIHSD